MLKLQTTAWFLGLLLGIATFSLTVWIFMADSPQISNGPLATHDPSHIHTVNAAVYSIVDQIPASQLPASIELLSIWFPYLLGSVIVSSVLLIFGYRRFHHSP